MVIRDNTAAFRRTAIAGAIPASHASPAWPAQPSAEQQSRQGTARAIQLAAGGLVTLGLLLAGWGAWHSPAVPRGERTQPAPAGEPAIAQPLIREAATLKAPAAAAQPPAQAAAQPAMERPVTLGAQHAAILAAASPATPDAVRTYLGNRGRNLLSVQTGPITAEGRSEVLLMGSGQGCASCHARWIAVWDVARQAPLWEADDGVDTVVAPVGDGLGFVRTDAVWSADGPECCHAIWENRYLTWDGSTFVAQTVSSPFGELAGMPASTRP